MGNRKTAIARLIIGPVWLILAVLVVIPVTVALGILYGMFEVLTLLRGRSLNSTPKMSRPLYRWSRSLWKWNWENIRWTVSGSAGGQGFQLTP